MWPCTAGRRGGISDWTNTHSSSLISRCGRDIPDNDMHRSLY
jgi:hypothetical protein